MWPLVEEAKRHGISLVRVSKYHEWAPCTFGDPLKDPQCANDAIWYVEGDAYCNEHTRRVLEVIHEQYETKKEDKEASEEK